MRTCLILFAEGLQETDNPDLRDRAYVYWRLLSTDPEAAKEVVLAEKPVIVDTSQTMEPSLLQVLLHNLALLASVYHKPPEVGPCLPLYTTPPMNSTRRETVLREMCREGNTKEMADLWTTSTRVDVLGEGMQVVANGMGPC